MPLCSYQQAPDRNDRTVVENIFLREFMPAAPEGAVKAYLYGLMQCQQGTGAGSLSAFARAVALSETEVQDAFAYWQEKGLVLVQTKPMFAVFYLDIHNALPQDGSVYTDSEYNREIQALFAPKAIQPAELARVYDWTDVFLIDRSAVPLLAQRPTIYSTIASYTRPTFSVFVSAMGVSSVPSSPICTSPAVLPKPLSTQAAAGSFWANMSSAQGITTVTPVLCVCVSTVQWPTVTPGTSEIFPSGPLGRVPTEMP